METVKKVTHTPGPWKKRDIRNGAAIFGPKDYEVAVCKGGSEDWDNAHLIAAAPELLEALKMAMNQLHCLQDYAPSDMKADETPAWQKMKAAIARAEGMNPNE